ncbi:MAG: hypothetical protein IPP69_14960 [Flavobacteriales bacterium]|nr:hypothetical protein [Flavobacteriales bacterium]
MENKNQPVESEVKDGKVIEHFSSNDSNKEGEIIKVKRARYDSLELFDVSENELTTIERGSPSSTYLNFAIFLLSIAISFLTTLLTVDLKENQTLFTVFTVICVLGFMVGLILIGIWYRSKMSLTKF